MIEILAPCATAGMAVPLLNLGADSLYCGLKEWSRSDRSLELTEDELKEVITLTHARDKKVYLSLNLIPSSFEFNALSEMVSRVIESGIDALIVSELGIISWCKIHYKKISLHASVGCSLLNKEDIKFYHDLGISRIVIPPYLDINEIKEIADSSAVEIEVFISGLKCTAIYLGRCLLGGYFKLKKVPSLNREYILNGSAKRSGVCHNVCLGEWHDFQNSSYRLAPKKIEDKDRISEFLKAGITFFKIGGRGAGIKELGAMIREIRKCI